MERIAEINGMINDVVWGVPTMVLMLGVGLFLSIRLGFPQIRNMGFIFKNTFGKKAEGNDEHEGEISSFQAAMVGISSVVGSGNIAGIATAITIGGPGAVFWMCMAALVGMATKFAEITLGVKYREVDSDGNYHGGPMYYLAKGLNQKWLGTIYACLTVVVGFTICALVDTNTMTLAMQEKIPAVPAIGWGILFAILTAIVIFGGIKSIGKVCEKLSPIMGGAYVLAGLAVILFNITSLPDAVVEIVRSAFTPTAAAGGFAGSTVFMAMRYGVARGIFSNEAGIGSAAIVHSSAKVSDPAEQGLWGPVEIFIDTIVVCTISGLAVVISGLWTSGESGAALTMAAFDMLLPGNIGSFIVLGAILLFGYSCLITWNYHIECASEFLFGPKSKKVIRVFWILGIILGSVTSLELVWDIGDTMNGLMIFPNLIGLALLSSQVVKLKKDMFARKMPEYLESKNK